MFVIGHFLSDIVDEHDQHPVSTKDGDTWYALQACKFLNIDHHIHSSFEKNIIERTMQYIKDRTRNVLMITFHIERKTKLKHVKQWFNLFAYHYNKKKIS